MGLTTQRGAIHISKMTENSNTGSHGFWKRLFILEDVQYFLYFDCLLGVGRRFPWLKNKNKIKCGLVLTPDPTHPIPHPYPSICNQPLLLVSYLTCWYFFFRANINNHKYNLISPLFTKKLGDCMDSFAFCLFHLTVCLGCFHRAWRTAFSSSQLCNTAWHCRAVSTRSSLDGRGGISSLWLTHARSSAINNAVYLSPRFMLA